MKYDIFISYRREGGYDTAKHLNDLLVRDGYKVSFDIDTLRSGNFDTQLLERIDQCKDFILIVDQHAFDRTLDPNFNPKNDWLRCELAYALKKRKNIIPIFLTGANGFPNNLPSDVAGVTMKNGPEYNRYHFNAFYKDLKKRFLQANPTRKIFKIIIFSMLGIGLVIGGFFYRNNYNDNSVSDTSLVVNSDTISNKTYEPTVNNSNELYDNRRHMEYCGIPMNTNVDLFTQKLKDKGYAITEKTNDCYQLRSDSDTIFVVFDQQNKNMVLGVTLMLGQYGLNDIGNLVMGFVESVPGTFEDFYSDDEYGVIKFSYGKMVIGENGNMDGTLVCQYIDSINTEGYKLWYY